MSINYNQTSTHDTHAHAPLTMPSIYEEQIQRVNAIAQETNPNWINTPSLDEVVFARFLCKFNLQHQWRSSRETRQRYDAHVWFERLCELEQWGIVQRIDKRKLFENEMKCALLLYSSQHRNMSIRIVKRLLDNTHPNYPRWPSSNRIAFARLLRTIGRGELVPHYHACVQSAEFEHPQLWFRRLSVLQSWPDGINRMYRREFCKFLLQELSRIIETNPLIAYRQICAQLNLRSFVTNGPPEDIEEAKELLQTVYINIWDLLEYEPVDFKSTLKLAEYTFGNNRSFDLDEAKNNPLLQPFLHVLPRINTV